MVTTQRVRRPRHAAPSILGDDRAGRVAWVPPPLSSAARCSVGSAWAGSAWAACSVGRLLAARSAGRSVGCSLLGRSGCSVGRLGLAARSAGCSVGRLARSAGSVGWLPGSAQPWPHRALRLVTAELTDRPVVCIPPGGTRIARILPTRQRTPARDAYECGQPSST